MITFFQRLYDWAYRDYSKTIKGYKCYFQTDSKAWFRRRTENSKINRELKFEKQTTFFLFFLTKIISIMLEVGSFKKNSSVSEYQKYQIIHPNMYYADFIINYFYENHIYTVT